MSHLWKKFQDEIVHQRTVLNAYYEAGIIDDMLALMYETNKTVTPTPNGLTEEKTISDNIMQADVLSPLLSSNMVDSNISWKVLQAGNVYIYKNMVPNPLLIMQDDTLAISNCGLKQDKLQR